MKKADIKDAKVHTKFGNTKKDEPLIEELEKELADSEKKIIKLENKLADAQERIHDVINDKKTLQKKINEFELKDINLEFGKFEDLKREHSKLQHRMQVTKNHLDDAREQIIKQEKRVKLLESVIVSLENRSLMDRISRRYPEEYLNYKKNNE